MAFKKTFPEPQAFSDKPRPPIPLTPVKSNQVAAIGYSPETKTLAVTFSRGLGSVYHYRGVEPETHAAFVASDSIGTYFGKHIKPLPFEKYAPEPPKEAEARTTSNAAEAA